MWWDFHRLTRPDPRTACRRGRADRPSRTDRADRRRLKNGKQTWRYSFPAQDYDLGRGEVYDPANKQARPNDTPFTWLVGEVARVDAANWTVDLRRIVSEPHPSAIVPLNWVRTKDHQASFIELGEWVATTVSRRLARTAPLATCFRPAAQGRTLARRRALSSRRDRPRGRAAARARARPHDARDPGAARIGQDLRRGPDDPFVAGRRQAGRHHGHEPQGHRQPPEGSPRRAGTEGCPRPPGAARREGARARRRSGVARKGRGRCPRTVGCRTRESRRRDLLAVGVLEDDRGGRCPVRRRGGPDLARQRHRHSPRDRQPRPARRSAAARPAAPGHAPTRAPIDRRSHTCWVGDATMPPTRGPVPREDLAATSRPVRLHLGGLLRRPARARGARSSSSGSPPARRSPTARGHACSTCRRSGPTTSRRSRRRRSRTSRGRSSRAAARGSTTPARSPPVGWDDS